MTEPLLLASDPLLIPGESYEVTFNQEPRRFVIQVPAEEWSRFYMLPENPRASDVVFLASIKAGRVGIRLSGRPAHVAFAGEGMWAVTVRAFPARGSEVA